MNIDKQIEFDKIKEMWKGLAVTDKAKEIIEETGCYLAESELRKQLRDTTNSRILIERSGTPPLQNVAEAKEILTIAGKGDCLTPYQFCLFRPSHSRSFYRSPNGYWRHCHQFQRWTGMQRL